MPVKPKKAPKGPIIPDNYICLPSGPITYNYCKDGEIDLF
jgi:hypothetical protein